MLMHHTYCPDIENILIIMLIEKSVQVVLNKAILVIKKDVTSLEILCIMMYKFTFTH